MGSYAPQIVALIVGAMALVAILIWGAVVTEHILKPCEPPPEWQCVGPQDTRSPNCKCLYGR